MRVEQLAKKIETEFTALFPREPDFIIGRLEDISGMPMDYSALVTEVLKSGGMAFAYHRWYGDDKDPLPAILGPNDLLYALRNSHFSIVNEISDSYVKNFENKADLLQTIMGQGLSKDKLLVHNILVVLIKTLDESNIHQIYDVPENWNLIELTVIAFEKWINELAE